MSQPSRPPLFPIFLDLVGRRVLVIGGGAVAARKVRSLLESGAEVRVIAPQFVAEIRAWAEKARLELVPRVYQPGDIERTALVIAATDDPEVNATVYEEAQAAGIWVNVVDDPSHCSFYVPSQVTRGPISIAISTQGESPALAQQLRKTIEETIPPVYGKFARLLGRLRDEVKAAIASPQERMHRWHTVVAESGIVELLAQDKDIEAEALARQLLGLTEKGRG